MPKKDKELLFKTLGPLLAESHFHAALISQERKCKIVSLWTKHFVPNALNKNEALWHTFSFDHFPHYFGESAVKRFNETRLKEFMIFSTQHYYAIECSAPYSGLLDYAGLCRYLSQIPYRIDVYIAQKNFKWTFVIPHEKDFGPYYADLLFN